MYPRISHVLSAYFGNVGLHSELQQWIARLRQLTMETTATRSRSRGTDSCYVGIGPVPSGMPDGTWRLSRPAQCLFTTLSVLHTLCTQTSPVVKNVALNCLLFGFKLTTTLSCSQASFMYPGYSRVLSQEK